MKDIFEGIEGTMFAVSGCLLYFRKRDIVSHDVPAKRLVVERCFQVTTEMMLIPDGLGGAKPATMNLINELGTSSIEYTTIGSVEDKSSIVKSINEVTSGLKLS